MKIMVRVCCVENCGIEWYPNINVTFHSFPWRDPVQLEKWIGVIPTKHRITKHTNICSGHFDSSDLSYTGVRRTLKKNAVPRYFHVESINNISSPQHFAEDRCLEFDARNSSSFEANTSDEAEGPLKWETPFNTTKSAVEENVTDTLARSPQQYEKEENWLVSPLSSNSSTQYSIDHFVLPEGSYRASDFFSSEDWLKTKLREKTELFLKKEEVYKKKIRMLQGKLRRKTRKISKLVLLSNDLQKKLINSQKLSKKVTNEYPEEVLELFNNEVTNRGKSKAAFRYTEKLKVFAMSLYAQSPKAYSFLRTKLLLPDKSILQRSPVKNFEITKPFDDTGIENYAEMVE